MKRTASLTIGTATLMLALLASRPTLAQTPAGGADATALTDQARELFEKGVKAIDEKRWPQAHEALLAAWQIKPHWQIAVNLGVVEMKLGKPRDAAEHLTFYLHEAPTDRKEERARAQAQLNEARKKIATVRIVVDVDGANLIIDNKPFGKSPVNGPVFFEPGVHGIEASFGDNRRTGEALILNAGDIGTVTLTIPPPRAAPAPAPSQAAAAKPSAATDAATLPAGADEPPVTPTEPPVTASNKGSRAILIAGLGTTVVALGAGIVFLGVASAKGTIATNAGRTLDAAQGSTICDYASLAMPCDTLDDLFAERDAYMTAGVWSLVAAAALGGGTAIYYFTTKPKDLSAPLITAAPIVSPQGGALVLRGSW